MKPLSEELDTPQETQKTRHIPWILRAACIAAIVLAGVLLITLASHPANRDYIEYWTSANLLIHRSNPYSAASIFDLEKAHEFTGTTPLIMLNPPWTLFLISPLGLLTTRVGLFLWTLFAVVCLVVSVRILNISANVRGFAYAFAPAVICLFSSQSSFLLLLGFALFLRLHAKLPFWAGASLLLMAIKPHLFLTFWVVLLVDSLYRRQFRIFAGFATALAAASVFPLLFEPHIWQHYFTFAIGYTAVQHAFLPTASMLFRALIDVHTFWLLFVPSALAIIWGLWYYARNRKVWTWTNHGMLLILVTILASPYGYFSDEIVLLPAIFFALAFPEKRKYSAWLLLAINTIALCLVLTGHGLSSRFYLWTPTTWLLWFLYATFLLHRNKQPVQPLEPENAQYT